MICPHNRNSVIWRTSLSSIFLVFGLAWLAIAPAAIAQSAQPQSVSIVDVLVLYSPQAADGAGGTNAMLTNIDLAVLEANTVLQNSQANARIRLVNAQEINYTESGSLAQDLAELKNPLDLYLGQASKLRDQYGADLVCLVTETGDDYDFYGLQGPSAANAFSIIRREFLNGIYDFPVALSFNFGCQLERPYADSVGAFPYAYGYSFAVSNTLYSTADAFSGQRLPFFSNPNILYQGVAAGVPVNSPDPADNTLVINNTAALVANFRGSAPSTLPPIVQFLSPSGNTNSPLALIPGSSLTLKTSATDPDGSISGVNFYAQDNVSGVPQYIGCATSSPYNFVWTNIPAGSWTIFVQAVDNLGATTRADPGLLLSVNAGNDNFAQAALLSGTNISISGTTLGATLENGEPDWNNGAPSVWYSWKAPANGRVTLSGSDPAMFFGAYTGSNVSNLTSLADSTYYQTFDFPVRAGSNYFVLIAETMSASSSFSLGLNFQAAPANDDFKNRAVLGTNAVAANNFAATSEPGEPDTAQNYAETGSGRTLWWTWTAPGPGIVVFLLNGNNLMGGYQNLIEGVYQGTNLTNLTLISSSADYNRNRLNVSKGDTYQIVVDGVAGSYGDIMLQPFFFPRAANDNFTNRITVTGNFISLTNLDLGAWSDPTYGTRLWWSWTAPADGYVTFADSFGQSVDVFTGSTITNLTEVANGSPISFAVTKGTIYTFTTMDSIPQQQAELTFSTIQITSPLNSSVVNEGTNLVISASTTTNDGIIPELQFFANGTLIGSASNAPFSMVWTNVPAGSFSIQAIATNAAGHVLSSPPISIQVNYGPILQITSPASGATFIQGANINLTATQRSGSGYLSQVAFFASGNLLGTVSQPPYSLVWTNVPAGNYGVSSIGTDALGFTHGSGTITVQVNYPVPGNNTFANATVFSGGAFKTNGTTLGGSTQFGEFVPASGDYSSVWYSWTAPTSGKYHITLQTSGSVYIWQYGLRIYTGPNVSALTLVNPLDGFSFPGIVVEDFTAQAGVTYSFGVLSVGDFTIQLNPAPANNDFTNATILSGLNIVTNGDNSSATISTFFPTNNSALGGLAPLQCVWYSWTAPASGQANLSLSSPQLYAVYTGATVSNLTAVVSATKDSYSFSAIAGTTYQIEVAYYDIPVSTDSPFTLNLLLTLPPPNDTFASRQQISGLNLSVPGTTFLAGTEPGDPGFYPYSIGGMVWYSWIAPADGIAELSCPLPFGVFTGGVLTNLGLALPVTQGYATFSVTNGVEYDIAVANAPGASNNFSLSLVLPKAQFVSPTNGSSFPAPASFEILARTIDLGAVVTNVSFYDGTNLLGTLTNAPFELNYTNVPPGIHTLTLQATDANGFITTNAPIDVLVRPYNDDFANRFTINGVATNIIADNSAATNEPGEYIPGGASGKTLWWTWTAPTNGTVTINSSGFSVAQSPGNVQPQDVIITGPGFGPPGPTIGPLIAVYTNSALTNLSLYATNSGWYQSGLVFINPDGTLTYSGEWYVLPSFSFPVLSGQTYQISLDGVNGSFGQASMAFNFPLPPPPPTSPANDNFSQRTVLIGSSPSASGTTAGATIEPGEPLAGNYTNAQTVWYSWTAPSTGDVSIEEFNDFLPTGDAPPLDIGVYTGADVAHLTTVITGNGSLGFYARHGVTYQISVASASTGASDFELSLYGPPSPPTALLQNSGMLPDGTFQLNLSGATGQSFAIQASTNLVDWVTIDIDTLLGSGLAFVDTDGILFPQRFYRVVPLDAFFESQSYGPIRPANDSFTNRSALAGTNIQIIANNDLATSEPGEFLSDGATGKTLWYSWTAPIDATVTLNTTGSAFATAFDTDTNGTRFIAGPLVSVFTGQALSNLVLVTTNSIRGTTPDYYGSAAGPMLVYTNCFFEAAAGVTYSISVDGCNNSSGNFSLSLSAIHPPFFDGEMAVSNGIYYLAATNGNIFGYYNYKTFPTLYHYDLGNESFIDARDAAHGAYLYDFTTQHFWYTTPTTFPYIFDFTLNAWLYYYPDTSRPGHYTTNPRYFYNFNTLKTFTQ